MEAGFTPAVTKPAISKHLQAWRLTGEAKLITGETLYVDGGYHIID